MASEDTASKQRIISNIIYRFLGGAAVGLLLLIIPYSLSSIEINWLNTGIALFFILLCGLLSSVLGKKFIDTLMGVFEFGGFY